jgi:hypothetical protein
MPTRFPLPALLLAHWSLIIGHWSFAAPAPAPGPYAGPASALTIGDSLPLADLAAAAPRADAPRELRLVLREAVTLTEQEKHGIPGGGGVRIVNVTAYGDLVLNLPLDPAGQPDWPASRGEIRFLGVNRIGFTGPLQPHPKPEEAFVVKGDRAVGRIRFPATLKEPGNANPRQTLFGINLDLAISPETFAYTPDPDPSIPSWRADKTRPAGRKVTGSWLTRELRGDRLLELQGRVSGPAGSLRLRRTPGSFFPVQSIDLAPSPDGLSLLAHASSARVDGHESQWAVLELPKPLDLSRFDGLRLVVDSTAPSPSARWPQIPAAALAFRVQGESWFSRRTAAPLLGGHQDHVVDFALFARGSAHPGVGGGPNIREFPDLSRVDAIAIGLANPFGVGSVPFTVRSLEAVRHSPRGAGEPPPLAPAATITIEPALRELFNGVGEVPKGLFGYHIANHNFQSTEKAPAWFEAPPVDNELHKFLALLRPGSLRPLDHTNFTAESGAGMVRPLKPEIARAGEAHDNVIHTITNENLWARPKWMDTDTDAYAEGIREMFRQIGLLAWHPDERPDSTLRKIEFWNEPFMWARHINRGQSTLSAGPGDPGGNRGRKAWNDPTQFNHMPAHLGARMYSKFFDAAVEGLRQTNPHVKIGGMSSGVFGEDFFSQLVDYVAPFLAASHDRVDFLTEHHYNTAPASIAASYDVATAWTLAKHGKRFPIWNTEANDLDDVAPGDRRSPEAAKAFTDLNRAYYNYRDILGLVLQARDKAAGRSIHALWGRGWLRNDGEFLMYRHAADLRGPLVVSESPDPALLPVAVNDKGRLVVYLLNDSPHPRAAALRLRAASSATVREASSLRIADDASSLGVFPAEFTARRAGPDLAIALARPLAPRELLRVVVEQAPAPASSRHITQHFADLVVTDLSAGENRPGSFDLAGVSADKLRSARRLVLRLVARDLQTGEAGLELAGSLIPLPAGTSEGTNATILDLPLDLAPSALAAALPPGETRRVPFTLRLSPAGDGATLYSASLLVVD